MSPSARPTTDKVVEAIGLTKIFRDFWMRTKARAVDGVDLEVHQGEIFGLLGPNGSGKSTIIKMILGLLYRTSGRLLVFGRAPTDVAIKRHIGFLPEESYLYRFLNPRETLDYYGRLFGQDRRTRKKRTEELLEMVGLSQVSYRAVGEFSKGMMRRIGLAQALINDPDFLILDEPTSGLDPIGTRQVKDLIIELGRRGKTIILSSHLLSDVEDVCDRMVVLYGGKIRAQGTAEELLADTERTVIQTPRLSVDTISRIDAVISEREGKAIEKVQAPRQRLESLFMDIVEKARQEQLETSGAQSGGATAEFLRADRDAQGDDLVDMLSREDGDIERSVEIEREVAAPTAEDGVIEDLMTEAPPVKEVIEKKTPEPTKEVKVDRGLIDELLGSDESEERDS